MRISFRNRLLGLSLALFALPLAAGCAFKPETGGGRQEPVPVANSPENLMKRFELVYERQLLPEYQALFTSDFRFTFSSQSDPLLAQQYGTSWGKDDEIESTGHLFEGFTSSEPPFEPFPAATEILMDLVGPQFLNDLTRPDSAAFYRYVVVPRVDLRITVASAGDPLVYEIDAPHDFYIVRGDVALLDADQPATADRWYIYRWDDKSPPPSGTALTPRLSSVYAAADRPIALTWGNLKSQYAAR